MRYILPILLLYYSVGFCQLNGTYTIGTGQAFENFTEAVNSLHQFGVNGQVTFNVLDGTYDEQIVINDITGSSNTNNITFQSNSGDSTDVVLQHAPSVDSLNYVIKLDGAKYIRFKQITLQSTSLTHSRVVDISGGCDDLKFQNNRFIGRPNTNSNQTKYAILHSDKDSDNNIEIANNRFEGGSHGIFLVGVSGNTETNLTITNNSIIDPSTRGIDLRYMNAPEIRRNYIYNNSSFNTYGMELESIVNGIGVINNKVDITGSGGGMGIRFIYTYGSPVNRGLVANNFVHIANSDFDNHGIQARLTDYIDFYHNSIHSTSTNAASIALHFVDCENDNLRNNVIANSGGGYSLFVENWQSTPRIAFLNSDYNDLYSPGPILANWYDTEIEDLTKWQDSSSFDSNSVFINPNFVSPADLHILSGNNATLDGGGILVAEVTKDIDGTNRNNPPDIGADEFDLPMIDGGIVSIDSISGALCSGTMMPYITFENSGVNPLTSTEINWSINTVPQPSVSWTGTLTSGNTTPIALGNVTLETDSIYDIKVWISNINEIVDPVNTNDTVELLDKKKSFTAGTYLIGSGENIETLTELATILNQGGVCDSVVFKVKPGTYVGQFALNELPGSSPDRHILIESQSGNKEDVIVEYTATNETENYVVLLNGTDYISFRYLTFKASGTTYSRVINIKNSANHNTIKRCIIEGPFTTSTSDNRALLYSENTRDEHNHFEENEFNNGSYGMYYNGPNGSAPEAGIIILNNTFTNQKRRGMEITAADAALIKGNTINITGQSGAYGISIRECRNAMRLDGNQINIDGGLRGIHISNCYANPGDPAFVVNNFISMANSELGLYDDHSDHFNFYFNSINITDASPLSEAISFRLTRDGNILNNIFSNQSGGIAVKIDAAADITTMDYNDLYTTGSVLGVWNDSAIADLSEWQDSTQFDSNSISIDPTFLSDDNLHLCNIALDSKGIPVSGVLLDIDGDTRNVSNPDIGADEFDLGGVPLVDLGSNIVTNHSDSVFLTASAPSAISYNWTPSIGLACDTCMSTKALPSSSMKYFCTVTDGCGNQNTDSVRVILGFSISGTVYNGVQDSVVTAGAVRVLKKQNGQFKFLSSVAISSNGSYSIPAIAENEKIILHANPAPLLFPNTLKTYYPDAFFWDSATVIDVTANLTDADITCINLSPPAVQGTGKIFGKTVEGNFSGGKVTGPGDPLNGLDVSLIDKSTSKPIAFDVTEYDPILQDSAIFSFDEIVSDVTYNLYVDVAGIPVDAGFDLEITEEIQQIYVIVIVDSNGVSFIDSTSPNNLGKKLSTVVSILPNPSSGIYRLNIAGHTAKVNSLEVEVKSLTGQTVYSKSNREAQWKHEEEINLSHLDDGIYILSLNLDGKQINQKLILQR